MCKISAFELSSIVHALIGIAEKMVHDNPCTQKEQCKVLQESRKHLYQLREDLLDILNKE